MWNLFRETSTTIIRKFCVREGFKKKIVEFSTKRLTPPDTEKVTSMQALLADIFC